MVSVLWAAERTVAPDHLLHARLLPMDVDNLVAFALRQLRQIAYREINIRPT